LLIYSQKIFLRFLPFYDKIPTCQSLLVATYPKRKGKADRPPNITLHQFRLEHEQVMKGQVAYATLEDQKRALRFFENFIGGSILLSKIRARHAEAFVAHRLSTVPSIATANKDICTL